MLPDVTTQEAGPASSDSGPVVDSGAKVADATTRDTGSGIAEASVPDAPRVTEGGVACGTRTGKRGLTPRTLTAGGLSRTYLAYVPANLDPATPVPLVYVFHGFTMSGQEMHDITHYADLADSEGFAVVFPDGQGGPLSLAAPWNVENPGQTVCGAGQVENATGDDNAFIDAMKADVSLDQCLDPAHVYATGFSMGGYLSHHIGCVRTDFRAIAPHSGGTIADLSSCQTGHVPVIILHGTSDEFIADGCDDPNGTAQSGFPPSATLWATKNGCQLTYTTIVADGDAGGNGQCYLYDGCPADGQVELCTFTSMPHVWAGGDQAGGNGLLAGPTYASATELTWAFFKKYAW